MMRAMTAAGLMLFFGTTLARSEDSVALAVLEHDRHPGLGHPPEGDADHRHGDPDDHHETPESPCHHHDDHTCCSPSPTLGLPNRIAQDESRLNDFVSLLCVEPNVLPAVRKLFHVPLI